MNYMSSELCAQSRDMTNITSLGFVLDKNGRESIPLLNSIKELTGLFHQEVLWKKLSGTKIKVSWIWDFVMNSTQVFKEGLKISLRKSWNGYKRVVDLLFCCVSLRVLC